MAPPGTSRRFWSSVYELAPQILSVDDARLFAILYGKLAKLLGMYLVRSLGGTLVACVPMAVILAAFWPFLRNFELAFFGAFAVATLLGLLWPVRSRS
jgi:hypothetical protein